jgi:adenylate kinase
VGDAADVALNLVFMGPPGAGKGTQAERFAREHGIPKISTGDILREAVTAGTELGRRVKALMDRGDLVGDDLIIGIVRDRLSRPDASCGFVLDGFPRTVAQAVALDEMLRDRGPLIVVEIQVPDEELVRRVVSRRICSQCGRTVSAFGAAEGIRDQGSGIGRDQGTGISRDQGIGNSSVFSMSSVDEKCAYCGGALVTRSDDSEAVVRDRLKVYWRDTRPMIAFYHNRPTYRAVDGNQPPERVRDAIVGNVASALGKPAAELKPVASRGMEKNA